jgi:hypothetical protein
LNNEQIEESPGQTTAGLSSGSQLVNFTDAASFNPANTSSALPEQAAANVEPSPNISQQCVPHPTMNFKDALYRTMRQQGKILDKLAKL